MSEDFLASMRQAITAAAENVYHKKKSSDVDSENFLSRLNHHSAALLDGNALSDGFEQQNEPFPSPNKFVKVEEEKCDIKNLESLSIELSCTSIAKLNAMFGDEINPKQSFATEIALPFWLCKFIFKAIQKEPISNTMEEECEKCNNGIAMTPRGGGGKRQKFPSTNSQTKQQNVSLQNLYEMFPDVPRKMINQIAKEKEFDYDQVALHLADQFFEIKVPDKQNDVETVSVIVPSLCPRIITEGEQRINTLGSQIQSFNEDWYSDAEFTSVEHQLDKLSKDQNYCNEMKTKYIGLKNAGMLAHYVQRAKELEIDKNELVSYRDRLKLLRTSDEAQIDLHEIGADRAVAIVTEKINICREKHPNLKKLLVITGYGKTTGISVLKPMLLKFLKLKGIDHRVQPQNQGVIEINLQNIHNRIQ